MSSNNIYELQHPDFIQNKYFYLYLKILSKPDTTGYTEKHHILPKSMGGSDSKTNLIQITSRKHFLAHYLLTKCVKQKTPSWYSMVKAFNMMNIAGKHQQRYINSRLYESNKKHARAAMSISQTGENNSQYGSRWVHHPYTKHVIQIKINEPVPFGYKLGKSVKCVGFDLYINIETRIQTRAKRQLNMFFYLSDLYTIYINHGFDGVLNSGYSYSQPNLVSLFSRYIPNFIPQNGKKRI